MSKWNLSEEFEGWEPNLDGSGFPFRDNSVPEIVFDEYVFERAVECHWKYNSPFKPPKYNDFLRKRKDIFMDITEVSESGLEVVLAANLCIGLSDNDFIIPQMTIGWYRPDFVIFRRIDGETVRAVAIEADGDKYHTDKVRDMSRDRWLEWQGFPVLRYREGVCFVNRTSKINDILAEKQSATLEDRMFGLVVKKQNKESLEKFACSQSRTLRRESRGSEPYTIGECATNVLNMVSSRKTKPRSDKDIAMSELFT